MRYRTGSGSQYSVHERIRSASYLQVASWSALQRPTSLDVLGAAIVLYASVWRRWIRTSTCRTRSDQRSRAWAVEWATRGEASESARAERCRVFIGSD